jgi:hypothetical protein
MSKLTLSFLESEFKKSHPFGTITKISTNKYDVYFDSRDNRTEAEKELDLWQSTADTRKLYTYYATNLIQLANKLNIETPETEYKMSKLNQEFEAFLKAPEIEYDEPLFFD